MSFLPESLFVKFDDRLSKDKYDADQSTCQKKNNNHCLVKTSFYSAVVKWVAQSMLLIASFCKAVILSGRSGSSTTIQRYELVSEAREHNLQLLY